MTLAHRSKQSFLRRHSLSLTTGAILLLWTVLYIYADPSTHLGSFFGNAIADWSGVVVMVLATKHMYKKGSTESRQPSKEPVNRLLCFLDHHSLTIFLVVTGIAWIVLFKSMDANSNGDKWLAISFQSGLNSSAWYCSPSVCWNWDPRKANPSLSSLRESQQAFAREPSWFRLGSTAAGRRTRFSRLPLSFRLWHHESHGDRFLGGRRSPEPDRRVCPV